MLPSSLIKHIGDCYPPYKKLSPKRQFCIAKMLWFWTEVGYAHILDENAVALTKAVIRRIWGSDSTMRKIVGKDYFTVIAGNNISGTCNAFSPGTELLEALLRCMEDEGPVNFLIAAVHHIKLPNRPFKSPRCLRINSMFG